MSFNKGYRKVERERESLEKYLLVITPGIKKKEKKVFSIFFFEQQRWSDRLEFLKHSKQYYIFMTLPLDVITYASNLSVKDLVGNDAYGSSQIS